MVNKSFSVSSESHLAAFRLRTDVDVRFSPQCCFRRDRAGRPDIPEELVRIGTSAGHPDKSGIQFPVSLLRLFPYHILRTAPVNAVFHEKIRADMYRVMYGTRRGGNTAQPLQFPVQLVKVFSRRTGTHTFKNLLHRVCQSCISRMSGTSPVCIFRRYSSGAIPSS